MDKGTGSIFGLEVIGCTSEFADGSHLLVEFREQLWSLNIATATWSLLNDHNVDGQVARLGSVRSFRQRTMTSLSTDWERPPHLQTQRTVRRYAHCSHRLGAHRCASRSRSAVARRASPNAQLLRHAYDSTHDSFIGSTPHTRPGNWTIHCGRGATKGGSVPNQPYIRVFAMRSCSSSVFFRSTAHGCWSILVRDGIGEKLCIAEKRHRDFVGVVVLCRRGGVGCRHRRQRWINTRIDWQLSRRKGKSARRCPCQQNQEQPAWDVQDVFKVIVLSQQGRGSQSGILIQE